MIVAFTVIAMLVSLSPADPVLRTLFALPLVLFLPGHALLRRNLAGSFGVLEYLTFAVGLSLATTLLAGLFLHLLDAMTPLGWSLMLGGITIAGVVSNLGFVRTGPVRLDFSALLPTVREHATTLTCSLLLLLAALAIARNGAAADRQFLVTELWLVPKADNVVTLGIKNIEGRPLTYDVELKFDGHIGDVWRSIELGPEQSWSSDVEVPVRRGGAARVEAWLYREGDRGTVYRRTWIAAGRSG